MNSEIWKDVVGYEGIYEVSSLGQVKTRINKTTSNERYKVRKWKQRTLKQKVSKDNTCRISLWKDGKEKTWLVHRVVAFAFIPLIEGKNYINHIDGSRLNNDVSNLEWCNHTENNNHAVQTGLRPLVKVIILINKETGQEHHFRGMTRASKFLNRNHGAISGFLKKGRIEIDGYKITFP